MQELVREHDLVRCLRLAVGEQIGDGDEAFVERRRSVERHASRRLVEDGEHDDVAARPSALPAEARSEPAHAQAPPEHAERPRVGVELRQARRCARRRSEA